MYFTEELYYQLYIFWRIVPLKAVGRALNFKWLPGACLTWESQLPSAYAAPESLSNLLYKNKNHSRGPLMGQVEAVWCKKLEVENLVRQSRYNIYESNNGIFAKCEISNPHWVGMKVKIKKMKWHCPMCRFIRLQKCKRESKNSAFLWNKPEIQTFSTLLLF